MSYAMKQLPAEDYAIFRIKTVLKDLKFVGGIPIPLNLFERMVERRERSKELSVFEAEERVRHERLNAAKVFLVKRNVLFIDPARRTRPQSKPDLLAIREMMKEA